MFILNILQSNCLHIQKVGIHVLFNVFFSGEHYCALILQADDTEQCLCVGLVCCQLKICLFIVSPQVLMEDRKTNRLVESCNIFETIINNRNFTTVSIILFLNKMDLLAEKIKHVKILDYFPEFRADPHNLEDVKQFLRNMFDLRRRERSKPLFHHFTTAVDTENIKHVFQDVKDTILHDNLRSIMLQ